MLNRIEARNFKSFKHLDYKCAKLNLLTGLNGAGKSSFVQLMLLLRATANRVCERSPRIHLPKTGVAKTFGDIKYCYDASNAPIVFSVDYSVADSHDRYKVIREIVPCHNELGSVQKSKEVSFEPLQFETVEQNKLYGYMDVWRRMTYVEAFHVKPKDVHDGNHFSCEQWFSDGKTFDPEGRYVIEFLCNYGDRLTLREGNPMAHLDSEFRPSRSCDCQERESTLLNQINAWLNELSPGASLCVNRIELGDEDNYIFNVGFGNEDDFRKFKPQNVGLGISYVLPVLSILLASAPNDILVIENPEAHIHPKGQSKIGELIARAVSYGVQVFVETHSDHVINGIRVAVRDGMLKPEDVNIAFFERKEYLKDDAKDSDDIEIYSEIRNIKIDDNGSLSEYPEDFMDEWNNQLLELM